MACRTFVFCDVCNPMCIRVVELRRSHERDPRGGRRFIDGRCWFEGSLEEALSQGWLITETGEHLCPLCQERRQRPADAVVPGATGQDTDQDAKD